MSDFDLSFYLRTGYDTPAAKAAADKATHEDKR